MPCAFKPCTLEINSNGEFKREHVESYSLTTKKHISTTAMPMATKRGRVATDHEGLPPMKSHYPLITWFCEITWQTETLISLLSLCLWPPNFRWWAYAHKVTWYWSRGLGRLHDKLKNFFPLPEPLWPLNLGDVDLSCWAPTHKVTWRFDQGVLQDHVTN